ncbi:MAG: GAF domain-containing protein [Cyclobacteriaceae bacterium]|nr:GAF domain-containing protein [Cyclobacteriaceae bacterium]
MTKKTEMLLRLFALARCFFLEAFIIVLLLPVGFHAQSQENKGLPFITNYRYQDYNADGINWWAAEDDNGVMYFANNAGVLVYDGQHWEAVGPEDRTETRCVVKGEDGKIYVGTYGDFGYLEANQAGELKFISLKNRLPEKYRQFAEVWECAKIGDKIFFRSNNYLFIWADNAIKVIESKEGYHIGAAIKGEYYVRIWNRGLTVLKADSFHIVPGGEQFANERIYAKIVINENFTEAYGRFGLKTLPGTKTTKSGVYVPLFIGEKVNSYISLQNMDHENSFSESDVRLLETLRNSMSVALENARLFDETNRLLKETEQRTAELGVINIVQEGLVREMNAQAIYDLVGDRISKLFDAQTVIIRTFDQHASEEHWQYTIEKGEWVYSDPRPLIWANKQLVQKKKAILINEKYIQKAKEYGGAGVSVGLPPKSALFVPMIVGDIVKGSVSLQNVEKENAFTESDVRLLTTLTNSMSVALENARLFDESNRMLDDAKQRANELSTQSGTHLTSGQA